MKKTFIILDAMAIAYRAYFAMMRNPLTTKSGEPTSAVYGFVNQMLKIIEDTKPDLIAVAFDSKEKTFRHEQYKEYKSSREEMPEDMIPQLKRINEIIEAFNISAIIQPGYEADDIAGTLAKDAAEKGYQVLLITPDKDYVQLITGDCHMWKPGIRGEDPEKIDTEKVKEIYGFKPEQMIDYLALIGDSSDDIPGVKGIGPKTATPLIDKYGSLENIYENIEEISSKSVRKKLEENKEMAFLSKELVTIKTDVPLDVHFNSVQFKQPDFEKIEEIFAELEFKTLFNRAQSIFGKKETDLDVTEHTEVTSFDKKNVKYTLITSKEEAEKLAESLSKKDLVVFDTETDSLMIQKLNLAGASFATEAGKASFVAVNPFEQNDDLFNQQITDRLSIDDFVEVFKPVFENKKIRKVCQNGKYDIAVLRNYGIRVENFYFDTMLASYVLDPDEKHNMDDLSLRLLNYRPVPFSEVVGKKKDPERIFSVDLEQLSNYAAEDADITYRLYDHLRKQVNESKMKDLFYDIEVPLVTVLEDMERTGVNVDKRALNNLSKKLEKKLGELTQSIFDAAGSEFNINSTQQLQHILFEKLGLEPKKKTKTGYSTNAQTLEQLKGDHEIIDFILDYRELSKLKSTYTDALVKLISDKTGRLHTSFRQTIASTGRLSSNEPNLQNIPIRTETGKEIRKAFVARDSDYLLLSLDYSQIELRIMASLSGDSGLMQAFKNGEDIHRATAAKVFNVKKDDVDSEMRRRAKAVNFGIMYGLGPFGLKTQLGITQNEAREIIDNYFKQFSSVKSFIDEKIEEARKNGYAETLKGRRRYLRNINSKNNNIRQFEERVAVNMPIQGTAADMIKIAMINVFEKLKELESETKLALQIHDELIFDARKDELDELEPLLRSLMVDALPLNVPVEVEGGRGKNWLEAH